MIKKVYICNECTRECILIVHMDGIPINVCLYDDMNYYKVAFWHRV